MNQATKYFLTVVLSVMLPLTAWAAEGTLGTTSTGQSALTLTVSEMVKITSVGDLGFGTYSGALADLDQNDNVCIYRNNSAGTYYVTATASEGDFELVDGVKAPIPYTVYFNDVEGTTGEIELEYNTKSAQQSGANVTSLNCGGGTNANFHVNIAQADITVADAGSYTGTLILLVEPQ